MFTFRFIEQEEILKIVPLVQIINQNTPLPILEKRIVQMAKENYKCIGAFNKEQLIGCMGLWFQTRHYSGACMEPDHVVIKPAYRNHGIGEKMLQFALKYAISVGCEVTELNCYIENVKGQKFWEKQGYKKLGFHYLLKLDLQH